MEPGTVIAGKFRVERLLGKGGMGTVVVATHLQLDQQVALKFLNPELAHQPAIAERFLREARSSAKLRSDYACRVMDVSQLPSGEPYIVMELLEGEDLGKLIAKHPLAVAAAADYVIQACVAIAEAHAAGIVHRDLKPSNLFLTRRMDGTPLVKVLDFGIATAPGGESRITQTASVMGSPAYMSPEQLRSARDVDARSDIWSLGVILYELVSGRLPFPGDSITEIAVKVSIDPPLPLDVQPEFDAVVVRAIDKDVAKRFQTVAELASALARFASPQMATLVGVIGKIVGGTRISQVDSLARTDRAQVELATTQPSVPPPPGPSPTTLGGSAAGLPVAASKNRGLLVGLAAVVLAGGIGAVMLATRGEATRPAIDAAPIAVAVAPVDAEVRDAPAGPLDADELAAQRDEVKQMIAEHRFTEVAEVGLGSDDPVVGSLIAQAKKMSDKFTRDVSQALETHDCARATEIAAMANNPTLTQLAHDCVPTRKPTPVPTPTPTPAADTHAFTVAQVAEMMATARQALDANHPIDAVASADKVLADRPQNAEALVVATTGQCMLRHPAIAKRLWARLGARQSEHGAVARKCSELGIELRKRD